MQLVRFGYLGKGFSGGGENEKHWILATGYWNDAGKWIDFKTWLDGIHYTALYYGEHIFTYNGYLITYE